MTPLEHPDSHHLQAAIGWLELGNWSEANEELDRITPIMRVHPDVLCVRWKIYSAAEKWEMAIEIARTISEMVPDEPFGWIHWAFSLHEIKRTKEAWNVLLPIVDKFPEESIIRYNLACYACQMGDLKRAFQWLEKAIDLAGKKDIRAMALEDSDLEPLWREIGEI